MIVENKSNIYTALKQINKSIMSDVNLYTRVGVVRESGTTTYTVELINEYFDYNSGNTANFLYGVENITHYDISVGGYVYLTYITNQIPIIFEARDITNRHYFSTTLIDINSVNVNVSGDTISLKSTDLSEIILTDKIVIKNDKQSLADLLDQLITAVKQISVPTPSGTSGYPLNVATFTQLATDIKELLQ
jgi:hypothetical protein